MATRFVDSIIAYRILMLLTTPFVDTDAYRLGIIDERGKELKKMSQLNTVQERDAYTLLHRLVFRIKRIIEKVPVENKKLLSFAAALALVKEHVELKKEPIDLESKFFTLKESDLTQEMLIVESYLSRKNILPFRYFYEEAPVNNAAATPGIAGFTPDTLGVRRKKIKILKRGKLVNAKTF